MDNCFKLGFVAATASAAIAYCWWTNPTQKSSAGATIGLPPSAIAVAEVVHPSAASVVLPASANEDVELSPLITEECNSGICVICSNIPPYNKLQPPSGHFLCCECLYPLMCGKNKIRKMATRCPFYDRRSKELLQDGKRKIKEKRRPGFKECLIISLGHFYCYNLGFALFTTVNACRILEAIAFTVCERLCEESK